MLHSHAYSTPFGLIEPTAASASTCLHQVTARYLDEHVQALALVQKGAEQHFGHLRE